MILTIEVTLSERTKEPPQPEPLRRLFCACVNGCAASPYGCSLIRESALWIGCGQRRGLRLRAQLCCRTGWGPKCVWDGSFAFHQQTGFAQHHVVLLKDLGRGLGIDLDHRIRHFALDHGNCGQPIGNSHHESSPQIGAAGRIRSCGYDIPSTCHARNMRPESVSCHPLGCREALDSLAPIGRHISPPIPGSPAGFLESGRGI